MLVVNSSLTHEGIVRHRANKGYILGPEAQKAPYLFLDIEEESEAGI
jgi:hypothetical protein